MNITIHINIEILIFFLAIFFMRVFLKNKKDFNQKKIQVQHKIKNHIEKTGQYLKIKNDLKCKEKLQNRDISKLNAKKIENNIFLTPEKKIINFNFNLKKNSLGKKEEKKEEKFNVNELNGSFEIDSFLRKTVKNIFNDTYEF
jgi:hypothetical protein